MSRNILPFEPTRSIMYIDCADEEYRIHLERWLYKTHIPESISIFQPYVSKYAFYSALPVPEGGDDFGAARMQLTEHYWLACPDNEKVFPHFKALSENMPKEMLFWQGMLPDGFDPSMLGGMEDHQDEMRQGGGMPDFLKPLVFAFIPVWWESDLKGAGRTIEDGPNYRWQFVISYPDEVKEQGDAWMMNEVLPAFVSDERVNRVLTSAIIKEASGCKFDRLVEIWFDGPNEWKATIESIRGTVAKPEWALTDKFPYVRPKYDIQCIFVSDIARSDNLQQYHGYITMR